MNLSSFSGRREGHLKGFTLIELLVVIAIIGILSSVVLASLNTARNKGADSAIKSQLAAIRPAAEILYDTNGCYGSSCSSTVPAVATAASCATGNGVANSIFADAKIYSQITAAKAAWGTGSLDACAATVGGTAWAAMVQLKTTSTTGWCVDSTGASKLETPATNDQTGYNGKVTGGVCG